MPAIEIFTLGFFVIPTFGRKLWPAGILSICMLTALIYQENLFAMTASIAGIMLFVTIEKFVKTRGIVDLVFPVAALVLSWPALCIFAASFTQSSLLLFTVSGLYLCQRWGFSEPIVILLSFAVPYGLIAWSKVANR